MESMPKLPKVTYTGSFKSVVAGTPGSVWKTNEDKPSYVDGRLIGRSKVLEFCLVRPGCWCKIPPPCVGLCAPFIACGSTCRTTCGSVCGPVCGPCFKLPGMCKTECGKVCGPVCGPCFKLPGMCRTECGKVCGPVCGPCFKLPGMCRTECGKVCGPVCGPCFKLPGMCRTECGKVCGPVCGPCFKLPGMCRTECDKVCGPVCGPCFKLPGMCRTECGKVCNPICNPICSFGKSCWAGCWGGCGKVCEPICTPCRSFGKSCWLALVPFMCCVCCTCHPRKPSIEVEGDKRLQVGYPCHIEACWYCGGCSLDVTFLWDLCGCLGPTSDLMQNGHFEPRELHNSKWAAKIPEAKRSVPKLTAAPAAQTMDANTA